MAYNDTPLPTETPSQSQPLIRQNFQQIATSWNADHISLSSGANVGFSNKTTYVSQISDPGSVGSADVVYAKTINSIVELFVTRDGSPSPIQLSSGTVVSGGNGQTFLPGAIQIKWGQKPTGATGTSIPVSYITQGLTNFPNATLVAFVIGNGNGRIYNISAASPTGFTVNANTSLGAGDAFYWLAIGN